MKIFITGGTGMLGNNIVRQCVQRGDQIICLVRSSGPQRCFEGLDLTTIEGSLADSDLLKKSISECDGVIHCAAHIQIGWSQKELAKEVNEVGTQHVADAALAAGVPLVHVSTVNTLPVGDESGSTNEDSGHGESGTGESLDRRVPSTYVVSKMASESVVEAAIANGLRASIVHPGFMLGPWDWKPSSGRMVIALKKQWAPAAPIGGNTVGDVRDVSAGVVTALDRMSPGRHYILGGNNVTFFDLWTRMCQQLGTRPPLTVLRRPGQVVVGAIGDLLSRFTKEELDINSAAIRMGSQLHWYDSGRAKSELDYQIRDLDESIESEIRWLTEYGYLS